MPATFNWCEDNGAQSGSPLHGTTRSGFGADTHFQTDVNWKTADDCTAAVGGTPYTGATIAAPAAGSNYSMPKYSYGKFSGTFNQISACKWSAHDNANALPTGVSLKGAVTSTYATPATTDKAFGTDFSNQVVVGSGLSVNFHTTGPEGGSPTATLAAAGYTQYLATQLVVGSTCTTPGDIPDIISKLSYSEN
jgi:hypothetical protein